MFQPKPLSLKERAAKLAVLSRLRRITWQKACQFDDIPVGSAFVMFSRENPYVNPNNRAGCLQAKLMNVDYRNDGSLMNVFVGGDA